MLGFVFGIIAFCIVVLITAINFQHTTTLSFLFFKFEEIPGIILLYIGIILGALICIPFLIIHSRKYAKEVLNRSIKTELKRLKQEEKKKKNKKHKNKSEKNMPDAPNIITRTDTNK